MCNNIYIFVFIILTFEKFNNSLKTLILLIVSRFLLGKTIKSLIQIIIKELDREKLTLLGD